MMLTGRNEWVAIAVLIAFLAFVPTPYVLKDFLSSSVGKLIALGGIVYVWKYVSCPVAILLLVVFLRSGAVREYLDETGVSSSNNYKCADGFAYSSDKKMCTKGDETKEPECTDSTMKWSAADGKCVAKPAEPKASAGGPEGGSTPGAMAAKNEIANTMASTSVTPPTTESFTPYGGKEKDFAPL